MPLNVMTWNLEHARKLVAPNPSADVLDRRRRVRETVEEVDPDIVCLQEGPPGEQGITAFAREVLGGLWVPVLLRGPSDAIGEQDRNYLTQGTQWIWFLVRPQLAPSCRLQSPSVWQAFVGARHWTVNYWGKIEPEDHQHYRHPQVLIMELGSGQEIELIGVHLKSKINMQPIQRDTAGNLTGGFLEEALKARVKLATEARDVRAYLDARFAQVSAPAILVMGDCNDGPGHDRFERQYLFFDLIANIQGDVLIAERFFNHALFDVPADLRWTAKFRDEVDDINADDNPLLLDHVLISQPLCRGELRLEVRAHAGRVEHEAFERANAGASSKRKTSDHRPASLRLEDAT